MNRLLRLTGLTLLVLAAGVITASPALCQEKLRWKFEKGETLKYEVKMTTDVMSPAGGIKATMVQDMTWTVKSVASDGTAEIAQKLTRIRMKAAGPFANQEFDTDKKDGAAHPLAALVGQESTMKLSARGEVKSVTIPESLKKAFKEAPGGLGGGLGGGGPEESFKRIMAQGLAQFPEKALSKGDTWNQKLDMKVMLNTRIQMDTKFTYQGVERVGSRRMARIDMKPKMTFETKDGTPFTVTVKDGGSGGKFYFDVAAGKLVKYLSTQKMEMEITVAGRKQKSTTTLVIEMVKK